MRTMAVGVIGADIAEALGEGVGAFRVVIGVDAGHQSRLSRRRAMRVAHHSSATAMRHSGGQQRMALVARKPANVSTSWGWHSSRFCADAGSSGWPARGTGARGGSFRWASLDLGVDLGGCDAEWLHVQVVRRHP